MEELNTGSNNTKKRERIKSKGQVLDMLEAGPNMRSKHKKNVLEVLITEEELKVWDLLARGATRTEISKELGIAQKTVTKRMNRALEKCRGWAGRQAEDWRNQQLLIIEKQISGLIADTDIEPIPHLDEDGEQMFSKTGLPLWDLAPSQAGKVRNMARQTLRTFLDHQAKLLNLMVDRKEVTVDQRVAIAVLDLGRHEDAASWDDI